MPTESIMDEETEIEVTRLLEEWAYGHPNKDRPFLILMGNTFTPVGFFLEVQEKSDCGISFLRFLSEQADRSREKPQAFIERAIQANRT